MYIKKYIHTHAENSADLIHYLTKQNTWNLDKSHFIGNKIGPQV